MKMNNEQKVAYVESMKNEFFQSAKTSTPEYQEQFNAMDIDKQCATIKRWAAYNEKKATGTTKTPARVDNLLQDLMCGVKREVSSDKCDELIFNFTKAIETLKAIKEENKQREKEELKEQIKQMQARLKELDK